MHKTANTFAVIAAGTQLEISHARMIPSDRYVHKEVVVMVKDRLFSQAGPIARRVRFRG